MNKIKATYSDGTEKYFQSLVYLWNSMHYSRPKLKEHLRSGEPLSDGTLIELMDDGKERIILVYDDDGGCKELHTYTEASKYTGVTIYAIVCAIRTGDEINGYTFDLGG